MRPERNSVSQRAALVTGASRGIGRVIAEALGEQGYGLTIVARNAERLEQVGQELLSRGFEVEAVAVNLADEEGIRTIVDRHVARFGRLDVLVNNAGVGIGAQATEHQVKHIDLQFAVNLRAIILFYREFADLLRQAGREHRQAWVINLASYAGKEGQPWLSVYASTKAGVISYTEAMNKELGSDGVRSVAICPGFVDTDMATFVKEQIGEERMIRPQDVAEAVRFLLRLSPACLVPEIVLAQAEGLPQA